MGHLQSSKFGKRFLGGSKAYPYCTCPGILVRCHASYLCEKRGASGAAAEGLSGQVFKIPEGAISPMQGSVLPWMFEAVRRIEEGSLGAVTRTITAPGNYLVIVGPTVSDWQRRQERGIMVGPPMRPVSCPNRNKATPVDDRGRLARHSKQRGARLRHGQLAMT